MQLDPPRVTLPYRGTKDTVAHMLAIGKGQYGELSYPVRAWTENAVRYVQPRDKASQLAAIYLAFWPAYRFIHDPIEREQVKTPESLIREMVEHGVALGDCDDASLLLWTAPRTIGIQTQLARVGFRKDMGTDLGGGGLGGARPRFSHVYAVGYDQYNRPIAMDPVAGRRTPRMLRSATVGALGLGRF